MCQQAETAQNAAVAGHLAGYNIVGGIAPVISMWFCYLLNIL